MKPRVSIQIPNFNNGRESSVDQKIDLINDLIESLVQTLKDDPTPFEIIAIDDGSTDDSLATLQRWAQTPWPQQSTSPSANGPVLRLIEREHTGILSIVANELTRESQGEVCVRLDGDIVVHTPNWVSQLMHIFDHGPKDLGVVGPLQLSSIGRVHALGDWLLHPRGYHHIATGVQPELLTRPIECDHVMGCFYCFKREVYDQIGGYDETFLRGQTIDFGVSARLHGWRCWAVPQIYFTHRHTDRLDRSTTADTPAGIKKSLDRFQEKWGFSRAFPDLDFVAEKYVNTPLLWNARVFGNRQITRPPKIINPLTPVQPAQTLWAQYATKPNVQKSVNEQLTTAMRLAQQVFADEINAENPPTIVVLGCGEGLLAHLLAKNGLSIIGVDHDPKLINVAKACTQAQEYPVQAPQFFCEPDGRTLPAQTHGARLWISFDLIDYHPNPVGFIRSIRQAAGDNPWLLIAGKGGAGLEHTPLEAVENMTSGELHQMLQLNGWQPATKAALQGHGQTALAIASGRPLEALTTTAATPATTHTSATTPTTTPDLANLASTPAS